MFGIAFKSMVPVVPRGVTLTFIFTNVEHIDVRLIGQPTLRILGNGITPVTVRLMGIGGAVLGPGEVRSFHATWTWKTTPPRGVYSILGTLRQAYVDGGKAYDQRLAFGSYLMDIPLPHGGLSARPGRELGDPLQGFIYGEPPLPAWTKPYDFFGEWAGAKRIVYVGSLRSDGAGVVVVAAWTGTGEPKKLKVHVRPDGPFRIFAAEDRVLALQANDMTDMTYYRFNVVRDTLTRM